MSQLIHNVEPISEEFPGRVTVVRMAGPGCGAHMSHMSHNMSHMSARDQRRLNWKLVVLVMVASAALISIALISQQLIVRHWAGAEERSPVTLQIKIPEEGWMSSQGMMEQKIHENYAISK